MNFQIGEESKRRHNRIKATVALSLAFVAGCVDIIGYIGFGHVFTAHLTGNTGRLGQGLIDLKWEQVSKAGLIIAIFVAGSILGRTVIEIGARRRMRSIAVMCLVLEALLIAAVAPLSGHTILALVLLAAAMGVQTATLTRLGPLTIHTTFVTGMLNKLAQLLSHTFFLTYSAVRGSPAATASRSKVLVEARLVFAIWFLYLVGAAAGTVMASRWGMLSLLLPATLALALGSVDLVSPLSVEEEKDASER